MASRYQGPIIDCHHHLWDLALARNPWVTDPSPIAAARIGNRAPFQRDYLPADYLADIADQPLAASVHVEAVWDRGRSPVEETEWLDSLPRPARIAARYVAHAPFAPGIGDVIEQHLRSPKVVGMRTTLGWNLDPDKILDADTVVRDPQWRAALGQVTGRNLLLELMTNHHEARALAHLAREVPGQTFVVNHCCAPHEDTSGTLAHWKEGITRLAQAPNIVIKVSEPWRYSMDDRIAKSIVEFCVERFGPARCMFGSNFPVAKRNGMSFTGLCDRMRDYLSGLSDAEQRAIFHDNAQRLYRI